MLAYLTGLMGKKSDGVDGGNLVPYSQRAFDFAGYVSLEQKVKAFAQIVGVNNDI